MWQVGIGAAFGAMLRFLLGSTWAITLGINIVACFIMGYVRPGRFWGTGFISGFSTMSTFAVLAAEMPLVPSAAYIAATIVGCVGAALAGDRQRA